MTRNSREAAFRSLRHDCRRERTALVRITVVIVSFVNGADDTPGQRLWLSVYRAHEYDQQATAITPSPAAGQMDPQRATQKWLQGMSRHCKESFSSKLRQARESAGLTQQQVSEIADLSVTGLAMIERGERAPSLDTAARICWALDVASGDLVSPSVT